MLRASANRAAAVLSQAGALLSWTSERADTFFVCERVRKAAADRRQPQRAEASNGRRREQRRSSTASDDEVGGIQRARCASSINNAAYKLVISQTAPGVASATGPSK